ncbi:MAG TPA: outer membrane beta-barrel protein [Myxococcales bacterium]|nr:outer membrane beta-barrel protein [Myxococcales bacterium]
MRTALALCLASLPALAAVPEPGEGTITLLGSVRTIIPNNQSYMNDVFATGHNAVQPGGIAAFGYQYDEELHVKIELGFLYDKYRIPVGGDLTVKTIPLLLGLDYGFFRRDRFTFFLGGGLGYLLNTGDRGGASNEANSTGAYASLGFRVQLGGPIALVIEDRYLLGSAQADAGNSTKTLNVGGNLLSVGVMVHFLEPEEKGHPVGH